VSDSRFQTFYDTLPMLISVRPGLDLNVYCHTDLYFTHRDELKRQIIRFFPRWMRLFEQVEGLLPTAKITRNDHFAVAQRLVADGVISMTDKLQDLQVCHPEAMPEISLDLKRLLWIALDCGEVASKIGSLTTWRTSFEIKAGTFFPKTSNSEAEEVSAIE